VAGKHSAGILLYRLTGGAQEVLLVHPGGPFWARRDLGAWTIPKGELEAGESALDCALRELGEELGAAPAVSRADLVELGSVRQKAGKVVEAWAAEADFDPAPSASSPRSIAPSGSRRTGRGKRSCPRRSRCSIACSSTWGSRAGEPDVYSPRDGKRLYSAV
jgi:predicted NUDIX family NTP pyrophosphohydrolase